MSTKPLASALIGSSLTAALFTAYLYWHDAGRATDAPTAAVVTGATANTSPTGAESPAAPSPSKLSATPEFLPPGMGLVGTAITGAQPSASFVIEGHVHTLGLGSTVPGTTLVVKSIQEGGVQLGFAKGNDPELYNIKPSTAEQIAQINAEARAATAVNAANSTNTSPQVSAADLMVLKDANSSVPLVDEMKITVRRRKMPTGGPVEVL